MRRNSSHVKRSELGGAEDVNRRTCRNCVVKGVERDKERDDASKEEECAVGR
jgi:hypothetical protein